MKSNCYYCSARAIDSITDEETGRRVSVCSRCLEDLSYDSAISSPLERFFGGDPEPDVDFWLE